MKEVSELLRAFLLGKTEFTTVMAQRLYALAGPGDLLWPFSIFRLYQEPATKESDTFIVTLTVHFEKEKYSDCAAFCDAIKPIVDAEYEWLSSEIEINEEDLSYFGIINFKITH